MSEELIVTDVRELHRAPVGSVVVTGSGFRYVKKASGRWYMRHASNTPASWLLDQQHSQQPIRLLKWLMVA